MIHVPVVSNRAEIKGEIINPGFYELLDSDLLSNLINYAGELSSMSSNKAVINDIIPIDQRDSDDIARSGRLIYLSQTDKIKIQNGSVVELIPIAKNDTFVSVFGKVTRPGTYPVDIFSNQNEESGLTLKKVLDIAGGFEDPIFRKTINNEIVILRLDENQFYGQELRVDYSDANSFKLEVNDKFLSMNCLNIRIVLHIQLKKLIYSPGTYPLKELRVWKKQ